MAIVTDSTEFQDLDNGVNVSATWSFDDVTGFITQYAWVNSGTHDILVHITQPGKADIDTVLPAGKTGTRRNIPSGYNYNTMGIEFRAS